MFILKVLTIVPNILRTFFYFNILCHMDHYVVNSIEFIYFYFQSNDPCTSSPCNEVQVCTPLGSVEVCLLNGSIWLCLYVVINVCFS